MEILTEMFVKPNATMLKSYTKDNAENNVHAIIMTINQFVEKIRDGTLINASPNVMERNWLNIGGVMELSTDYHIID